jgi:ElaB/YqjD/DUF883 family membrane-anchored ribosome-binding protein
MFFAEQGGSKRDPWAVAGREESIALKTRDGEKMRNAASPAGKIDEQLADARANLTEDVRSVATEASTLTDWRHHFHKHPWLFAGAAAALGFVLTPRRRRGAYRAAGPSRVTEAAESKQPAGLSDAITRSRNGMLRASIASLTVAIVEEGLILGVRRGRELLSHPPANVHAEEPAAGSKQPISRDHAPEVISNGPVAPSQPQTGAAELQQTIDHLQRYLKGAMADHPKVSLVAAAAAGVVLAWSVKRK